ncbi:hypothetical protein [Nocardiopsis ansamitocini]|uniref:Uncharacterized protein n=1 Tax=Nocardiopsis ansamitocini TaxID=1670832 RepID=A0A9W6P8M0_9ACTN|nr:hypothetical protein [Nocardiopsis ansamitocini]GLU49600.1 hypothetical protein Nans01_39510 [Nocardiopsis ansamitocini]
MSNALRHAIGGVAGLVATPLIVAGTGWGSMQLAQVLTRFSLDLAVTLPGLLALATTGLLIGLLAGSRLSPLGSLVPGVVLTVWGVCAFLPMTSMLFLRLLPLEYSYAVIFYPVLGVLLVGASLTPSRWRAVSSAPAPAAPAPRPLDAQPWQSPTPPWQQKQVVEAAQPQDAPVPHLYGTGPIPQIPAEPMHLYGTGPIPRITDEPEPPR